MTLGNNPTGFTFGAEKPGGLDCCCPEDVGGLDDDKEDVEEEDGAQEVAKAALRPATGPFPQAGRNPVPDWEAELEKDLFILADIVFLHSS